MITVHILEWMHDLTDEGRNTPIRDIDWRHLKPGVEFQLLSCSQSHTIAHGSHLVILAKQDYDKMKVLQNTLGQSGGVFESNPNALFMMVRLGPAACKQFEIPVEKVNEDGV